MTTMPEVLHLLSHEARESVRRHMPAILAAASAHKVGVGAVLAMAFAPIALGYDETGMETWPPSRENTRRNKRALRGAVEASVDVAEEDF